MVGIQLQFRRSKKYRFYRLWIAYISLALYLSSFPHSLLFQLNMNYTQTYSSTIFLDFVRITHAYFVNVSCHSMPSNSKFY